MSIKVSAIGAVAIVTASSAVAAVDSTPLTVTSTLDAKKASAPDPLGRDCEADRVCVEGRIPDRRQAAVGRTKPALRVRPRRQLACHFVAFTWAAPLHRSSCVDHEPADDAISRRARAPRACGSSSARELALDARHAGPKLGMRRPESGCCRSRAPGGKSTTLPVAATSSTSRISVRDRSKRVAASGRDQRSRRSRTSKKATAGAKTRTNQFDSRCPSPTTNSP